MGITKKGTTVRTICAWGLRQQRRGEKSEKGGNARGANNVTKTVHEASKIKKTEILKILQETKYSRISEIIKKEVYNSLIL